MSPASQAQIRSARRLVRRKERIRAGLFLAEGRQAVREALAAAGVVAALFVGGSSVERHGDLIQSARAVGVEPRLLSDQDIAGLSDTVTPQGVVAVCRVIDVSLDQALAGDPRLVVCCAQVRDPGNAGTVIRCADAFGADAVLLSEGSVDLYNAKTVRATVGSLFHLPLVQGVELATTLAECRRRGLQVLAADGAGAVDLDELKGSGGLARPTVWLMGNEAWGLPAEDARLADQVVRVPIYGAAESLNLSTAAAVCLYATAAEQRHRSTGQSGAATTGQPS
nr:RNA methyltransferase [Microlunatus panaciterrae]